MNCSNDTINLLNTTVYVQDIEQITSLQIMQIAGSKSLMTIGVLCDSMLRHVSGNSYPQKTYIYLLARNEEVVGRNNQKIVCDSNS